MVTGRLSGRRRIKVAGEDAFYHCVSRVVDRRMALGADEKEMFCKLLRRYSEFCGVTLVTYCVMSNHFHVVVKVPRRPPPGEEPDDAELLRRLGAILRPAGVRDFRERLGKARAEGDESEITRLRASLMARMWDVSGLMKELKQRFTLWYNRKHARRGTLWEERFRSVLLEGAGRALCAVSAYVDLNPVRAGILSAAGGYRWSGFGRACAGRADAVAGLRELAWHLGVDFRCGRAALLEAYGRILDAREPEASGLGKGEGNRRPLGRELRSRIRYFVDGAAVGGRKFVAEVLEAQELVVRARAPSILARKPTDDTESGTQQDRGRSPCRFAGRRFGGQLYSLRNLRVRLYSDGC